LLARRRDLAGIHSGSIGTLHEEEVDDVRDLEKSKGGDKRLKAEAVTNHPSDDRRVHKSGSAAGSGKEFRRPISPEDPGEHPTTLPDQGSEDPDEHPKALPDQLLKRRRR
jgi:hypothetical protein